MVDDSKIELLEENQNLHEEVAFYIKRTADLTSKLELASKSKIMEQEAFNNLEWKIKKAELDYEYFINDNQKLKKEIEELKSNNDKMIASYSHLIVKLRQAYETQSDTEKRISSLEANNSELYFRSTAFDEMTPRPCFDSLFTMLNVKDVPSRTTLKVDVIKKELSKLIFKELHNRNPRADKKGIKRIKDINKNQALVSNLDETNKSSM